MKKTTTKKISIWILVVVLFMAHFFFRTTAYANEDWKHIQAKTGECVIDFPSIPQMVQQSLKISESGHHLNYDIYLAPFEDKGVFLLLIATYPLPLSGGHEIAGLEGLLKGIVGHNPENLLVFADLVEFHNHPGINFLVENSTSYFRGRAIMVGNKLFLIAMEGRKGSMQEGVFARFIQSFQLLLK